MIMSKGPKGPRNPMGWGNDDSRVIKREGQKPQDAGHLPRMHGSRAEWNLMSGTGALIKLDATRVPLTGGRPEGRQR